MKADDIAHARTLAEEFIAKRDGGKISTQLGDGGSAVVFKLEQANVVHALKVYDPKFFASDGAQAEQHRLSLQKRLIGHHCPSMIDTLAVDEDLGTCFLTMEYFAGHELKKVLGKVPDESIPSLISQLVEAVLFLEQFGLVHRDIKPENILISEDFTQLKLLDLGVVREISTDEERADATDHGQRRPFIATAQYSSPEYLFRLEPPSAELWKALTLYQVGGVLHDLVCKRPLFEKSVAADNKYALAMSVMRETANFDGVSPKVAEWAALAARCLTKDSSLRLQIVDWPDFKGGALSPRDQLKRTLAARGARTDRAIVDETRIHELHRIRESAAANLIQSLRQKLVSEYSPQLRISELPTTEGRASIVLSLADEPLGVALAVEFSWESGTREKFASVHLAAIATAKLDGTELSGKRKAIGETDLDSSSQVLLVELLIDAISEILIKHSALTATGNISEGADLISLTWMQPDQNQR